MPPDVAELTTALANAIEPELERDVIDLGLVRHVESVRRGRVEVTVAHPAGGYPCPEELEARVVQALSAVAGVRHVEVTHDVLDEAEQHALALRLVGDPASTAGSTPAHGHAEGRAIPFADPASNTRCLLVASGKGGVGKSTVTVNLAIALAAGGRRVAVVDADVWGFSVPAMLGVDRPPLVVDRVLVPPERHGVRCISMGFFTPEDQAVIWRGPMLHKAIEQFLTDVFWNEPDILLVDLPPGTGDISISLAGFLPRGEVLVVTTPQLAAQRVAFRAGAMATKVNLQTVGVIENMSGFTAPDGTSYELFGAGGGERLAESLSVPLVGRVPLTMGLREGGDVGVPVVVADPADPASKAFAGIAAWLDEHGPRRVYRSELRIV